jgi:predicted RNase H-like nuclease (RuvC/YqgF family)
MENSKDKDLLLIFKSSESKLNQENLGLKSEIKNLQDNIFNLENEKRNLFIKLQENLKLYNTEIKKRKEDFEFLKKAYEDQKNKIIKEHETITNSMYEVIQEFMGIKTEMNKKAILRKLSENGNATVKNFSMNANK